MSLVIYHVSRARCQESHEHFLITLKKKKSTTTNLQAVGTKWWRVCYQWSLLRPFSLTQPQGRVSLVVVMSVCLCVCHKRCNCQLKKNFMWRVTPETGHVTCDLWHMTHDKWVFTFFFFTKSAKKFELAKKLHKKNALKG